MTFILSRSVMRLKVCRARVYGPRIVDCGCGWGDLCREMPLDGCEHNRGWLARTWARTAIW